jgi:tetratricopeptide (TPR) repeat protein
MKVKFALAGLMAFVLGGMAQAQEGGNWKWPSDPKQEAKAREFNAAYVDYMKAEQFVEATKPLNWLLQNAPDLNESIYINGVTVYNGAVGITTDAAQKRVYQDSVMTVFDKRKEFFNNESKWIENKAYYAYQFYRGDKSKLNDAVGVYDRVVEVNGTFNTISLVAYYFDLVYRNSKAYTKEEILSRYEKLSALVAEAEANGKDVSVAKSTIEQLVVALDLIDCEFIEKTLGPKLSNSGEVLLTAEQIVKYSVQNKCINTDIFLKALEIVDSEKPTFGTSQIRALRYMQNKEYDKALPILEKALTLAENDAQKADIQIEIARIFAQNGRKNAARSAALDAAKLDAEKSKEAWNMIGQLYMTSFNECSGGQSRAKDYSVFIAAYNAYQRAGNSKGMSDARSRFPSKEELFTEGKQPGESINTGCWIGETVTLSTRD